MVKSAKRVAQEAEERLDQVAETIRQKFDRISDDRFANRRPRPEPAREADRPTASDRPTGSDRAATAGGSTASAPVGKSVGSEPGRTATGSRGDGPGDRGRQLNRSPIDRAPTANRAPAGRSDERARPAGRAEQ
ncbi:hypothetical protein [Micromonospora sp. SH-82]|uniref:hypothetical protein n=1 Tax=Micromonospora sp. SH-82 TaxID=3132938 RepID=UPI003EBE349D